MSAIPIFRRLTHAPAGASAARVAAILSILGLSALLGWQTTPEVAQLILLAVGGLVAIVVLILRLEWGIIIIIPLSFLVRYEISTGTNVPLNAAFIFVILMLGLWLARMMLVEKAIHLLPSRLNAPAMAFIAATSLSLITGNIRWVSPVTAPASLPAQLGGYALYVLSVALLLLVGNGLRSLTTLKIYTGLFLATGSVYILGRFIPWLGRANARLIFAPGSLGSMFWIWLVAMALGQILINPNLGLRWRLALSGLVGATLYAGAVQSTEWLSGWLPTLVAVIIVIWLRSWRWGVLISLVCLGLLIAFLPAIQAEIITPGQEFSRDSRLATFPIMFELIKANPLLGLGPSNYYHYSNLYPILGWYVKFNSHNNYIDIVAQTGLLGFGLFAWLVVEIARLGMRLRASLQEGFSKAYVTAALGGLGATLVAGVLGDWFLPFNYNVGIEGFRASSLAWIFFGGLMVIQRVEGQARTAETNGGQGVEKGFGQ